MHISRVRKRFGSDRSRYPNWIHVLCLESHVNFVKHFDMCYNESLPSDHAPIVATLQLSYPCLEMLTSGATELGTHGAKYAYSSSLALDSKRVKRTMQFGRVDCECEYCNTILMKI